MAVLDGKYEILAQTALSDLETQFDAVAPDGRSLRIVWYDLTDVTQEARFERYRRVLRRLRRADLAALHDIVSRPGAHYVAWYAPDKASWAKADKNLTALLSAHDYQPESADIRVTKDGKALVFDLAFDPEETLSPVIQTEPEPEIVKPRGILERLPTFRLGAWGLSAILLLVSLGLGLASFQINSNLRTVQIPDVVGQDVNVASRELHRLKLAVEARAVASERPAGEVLSASPDVGTMLKPYYRTVRLSYAAPSDAVGQTQVPDLSALSSLEDIQAALSEAGLELGQTLYTTSDTSAGSLIAQTPSAESLTNEGEPVDILLSEGAASQLTLVPNLVGQTLQDAQFLVGIAGLRTPVVERIAAADAVPGTVIEQTIAPFRIVSTNDALLRLYVAASEEGERVPALIGLSQREAQTLARDFELSYRTLDTPDLPSGVVNQNPAPGAVSEGGRLELTINTYAEAIPIPVPAVSASVRSAEARTLRYAWPIERGVREVPYTVEVTDNRERTFTIQSGRVSGGERVEGEFRTEQFGPYTFRLYIQDSLYSIPLERD